MIDVGAVSYLPGNTPTVGTPSPANSVIGTTAGGGGSMVFAFNSVNNTLVVGRPASRIVTIFDPALASPGTSVSGRVSQSGGRGVTNAIVTITDESSVSRQAMTDRFGQYSFDHIAIGHSYTMTAAQGRFHFEPITVVVTGSISNADFQATTKPGADKNSRVTMP